MFKYKKDQMIHAKITEIDFEKQCLSLTIDPFELKDHNSSLKSLYEEKMLKFLKIVPEEDYPRLY